MGRPSDAKQRLIAAAKEVIYSQSYEAVSVDELCAVAGVNKSSFYHFFPSKQDLVLATLEGQWQRIEETFLQPAFVNQLLPQEQILYLFELLHQNQQDQKQASGHMYGCPLGNLTLEMSTLDEALRERITQIFQRWLNYFEQMLREAKAQGTIPATLDTAITARALLAYFEGVLLLAKGYNDPLMIQALRTGMLSLMHYQGREYAHEYSPPGGY